MLLNFRRTIKDAIELNIEIGVFVDVGKRDFGNESVIIVLDPTETARVYITTCITITVIYILRHFNKVAHADILVAVLEHAVVVGS